MAMFFHTPGITLSLALALGILAQVLAHHFRIPGIIILLLVGVLVGPDILGILNPRSLGPALNILTGFAVSVILFEGGMNLNLARLRRMQQTIRRLIVLGGGVTVLGGFLVARYLMQWPLQMAFLFGTLIMVTGPTVINPLLKRLKVKRSVATVLEAEGVLIDAVGAVVAMVALEAALSPVYGEITTSVLHVLSRLIFGTMAGLGMGGVLVLGLRKRHVIPEGMENVFTLCMVLFLFHLTNSVLSESGIAAVTVAGIIVGNFGAHARQDLLEFKEELTLMLIGMLFLLLAADVRLDLIRELGWSGVIAVLVIILVVRPVAVFWGTLHSTLSLKERMFIALIGPRGIVAAAVASLFAAHLSKNGLTGGLQLRALVFLVITLSVLFSGLTGGLFGGWLGVRRPIKNGWIFLGANELARTMAKILKQNQQEIICIDSNPQNCRTAEEDCTKVIFGNGLESRYLMRAEVDTRAGVIALTPNDEVNYLFAQKAKQEARDIELHLTQKTGAANLNQEMLTALGVQTLFGVALDVELWCTRIRRKLSRVQKWRYMGGDNASEKSSTPFFDNKNGLFLIHQGHTFYRPISHKTRFKIEDQAYVLVFESELMAFQAYMKEKGWALLDPGDIDPTMTSLCAIDDATISV